MGTRLPVTYTCHNSFDNVTMFIRWQWPGFHLTGLHHWRDAGWLHPAPPFDHCSPCWCGIHFLSNIKDQARYMQLQPYSFLLTLPLSVQS